MSLKLSFLLLLLTPVNGSLSWNWFASADNLTASMETNETLVDTNNVDGISWWQAGWDWITYPYTSTRKSIGDTFTSIYEHSAAKYLAYLLSTYSGQGENGTLGVTDESVIWWRRKFLRKLFANDVRECMALFVCEACANTALYGRVGNLTASFFQLYRPVEEDGPSGRWYSSASELGFVGRSSELCGTFYPSCPWNASDWTYTVDRKLPPPSNIRPVTTIS